MRRPTMPPAAFANRFFVRFATCGSTKVGMVRLEKVKAERNQVGCFQISASFGNHACSMLKFRNARNAIMFHDALKFLSTQMNMGAKRAEETK